MVSGVYRSAIFRALFWANNIFWTAQWINRFDNYTFWLNRFDDVDKILILQTVWKNHTEIKFKNILNFYPLFINWINNVLDMITFLLNNTDNTKVWIASSLCLYIYSFCVLFDSPTNISDYNIHQVRFILHPFERICLGNLDDQTPNFHFLFLMKVKKENQIVSSSILPSEEWIEQRTYS